MLKFAPVVSRARSNISFFFFYIFFVHSVMRVIVYLLLGNVICADASYFLSSSFCGIFIVIDQTGALTLDRK